MADSVNEATQQACPNCGCERIAWPTPNGYDGKHCCKACANGQPCTCGCEEKVDTNKDDRD